MPARLYNEPIADYQDWAAAPTGKPGLDRLFSGFLAPNIGVGSNPVGTPMAAPSPLAAMVQKAVEKIGLPALTGMR